MAENSVTGRGRKENSLFSTVLDMIRRRPLRPSDIEVALRLSATEVDELVRGLLIKGYIRKQEHAGEIYYLSNENIHHR